VTRSRLSIRLLAVSLGIAVSAVLVTAWLTSQATTERVAGELSRSLEADGFIYGQLTSHASVHADWEGVDRLLAQLSRQSGRAIALRSYDGPLIAGVLPSGEPVVDEAELPTAAAATVDPFAPLLNVVPAQLGPLDLGTDATPWGRLRPDELADLRVRTLATGACLIDRGIATDVLEVPEGVALEDELFVDDPEPPAVDDLVADTGQLPRVFVGPEASLQAVASCGSLTDGDDTEQSRLLSALHEQVASCLDAAGIHRVDEIVAEGGGGSHLRAAALPTPDQQTTAERCEVDARRGVLAPYVAAPALLYLWDPQVGGPWSRAGMGRTVLALVAVLAVTVGVTVAASRRLVRPLQILTDASERLAAGDRSIRTDLSRRDEIGRLATAFDLMAVSLRREEERRRSMVSDISHELRNPLTNLRGHLDAAAENVIDLDEQLIQSLQDETGQLERVVEDLHQLTLSDAGELRLERQRVDASELIAQVARAHLATAHHLGVALVHRGGGPIELLVDPARIRQALGNLVHNALRYTPAGGSVEISATSLAGTVQLTVTDTGIGIAEEHLPHVFERFYRADPSRSRLSGGSGLGLALVRSLIGDHDGTVDVRSEPGRGSTFVIRLPRPDATPSLGGPARSSQGRAEGS
jgi:two-component system, OmpR family, sensor histidine kinase BaeS